MNGKEAAYRLSLPNLAALCSVSWKSTLGDPLALYAAYCLVINPPYVIHTEMRRKIKGFFGYFTLTAGFGHLFLQEEAYVPYLINLSFLYTSRP